MIKISALVMAGGKGSRMGNVEKPLLIICGKRLIERVIETISRVQLIENIYVAVSKSTEKTRRFLSNFSGIKVIVTSGKSYVEDLKEAIIISRVYGPILILPCDLPLITPNTLKRIIEIYLSNNCPPAMTFYVPYKRLVKLGVSRPEYIEKIGDKLAVPCGVSIIEGKYILKPTIPQVNIVINDDSLALNVNTKLDLKIAQKILCKDRY